MLNDLVTEAVIHDQAFLRLVDQEIVVGRRAVFVLRQHEVKEHDIFQDIHFEADDGTFPPFSLSGFQVGRIKPIEVGHDFKAGRRVQFVVHKMLLAAYSPGVVKPKPSRQQSCVYPGLSGVGKDMISFVGVLCFQARRLTRSRFPPNPGERRCCHSRRCCCSGCRRN